MAAVKEVIGNPDWASLRKKNARISGKVDDPDTPQTEDKEEREKEPSQSAPSKPTTRIINKAHFLLAFEQVFPSYSENAQNKLYRWHETYSPDAKGARSKAKY